MIFHLSTLKSNLTLNDIIVFCLFAGIITVLLFFLDFYFIKSSGENK